MKKKLNYEEAFAALELLTEELENGSIPIDQLAEKARQAKEYVAICNERLKSITNEITIINSEQ